MNKGLRGSIPDWKKNLYSIWIAQFVASVGLNMIMPFLPFFIRELGVTAPNEVKVWSGIVFAAPLLLSSLMQPIWVCSATGTDVSPWLSGPC